MKTMEQELIEQIEAAKAENQQLKQQLEIAQAIIDEIALGGVVSGL